MRNILIIFLLSIFCSCTSCNSNDSKTDVDNAAPDKDSATDMDKEQQPDKQPDADIDADTSQDADEFSDTADEVTDVDMYCPSPMDANYPYFRRDGTIHFCRPCDTPDEYDPQCVKSLWRDLNKDVYDKYMNGEFEDNQYVVECYPWPCEWNVEPTPNERVPLTAHQKCDIFLNPRTWANDFSGIDRKSNMENGKVVFWLYNYRISTPDGYNGQRAVMYDIATGKYTVLGKSLSLFYMNNHIFINPYLPVGEKGFRLIVDMVPYKDSYKYSVIFTDEDTNVSLSVSPYITDKWTIMNINHLDDENGSVDAGNRSLVYAKTGEWKWTTLAYGNPDGKAGELSIAGDNAMFYHYGTDASWICDLSKSPKKITTDCKRIGKENEVAGFPKFDRDNPNRIAYRPMADGIARNHFVIEDISKDPWKIEKEFDIPPTEENYLKLQLTDFKSDIMLYREDIIIDGGYDGKLCYYRIDKEKVYCSKPLENQSSYGHGWPAFEGKYLFWQPAYKAGYILRDMECYCKEEGVCPFEE